jgi:DsbC/DsbD-like thiol-disulfide interchange protein
MNVQSQGIQWRSGAILPKRAAMRTTLTGARRPHVAALLIAGSLLLPCSVAQAGDASAWSGDLQSSLRLISGSPRDGNVRAGIELKLQPGWKTYWRYPGDSGVPPRFDFSGSDNVRAAQVLWPAPHAFPDGGGISIGYKDDIVFPVLVTPRDPNKPVTLRLKADYAVCEKLCVPAEGKAELTLAGTGALERELAAAEARVPKPVAATDAGVTAKRIAATPKSQVRLTVAGGADAVFVEGPTADWALPLPQPVAGAPTGSQAYEFALDGAPSGTDPKAPVKLTVTLVRKSGSLQTNVDLD